MEKLLEPFGFSFGRLQDIATLIKQLKRNHIPVIKFVEYVEQEKTNRAKINKSNKKRWEQNTLKCPDCQSPMNLFPVNTVPGDQTGDGSQSVWMCPKCGETVYNLETVAEILTGME